MRPSFKRPRVVNAGAIRRRARPMLWYRRLANWVFPARASVQTWMLLTFLLFVGAAVVSVGLYVAFVLQGEVEEATLRTVRLQAEQMARQVENADSAEERRRAVGQLNAFDDVEVAVATADSVFGKGDTEGLAGEREALLRAASESFGAGVPEAIRVDRPRQRDMIYVTLARPESGMVLRIGQEEPPLVDLTRRVEAGLIAGMVMALLMALLGSWVASRQVTRPLQAIGSSARQISEGRFEDRISVDSRAVEFQELARSLNRMSGGFRGQIEELQRMARIQNEFIGNVSHEVRNPIFAVSGYLEALGSSSLAEDQRKRYAEKGLANLQRLNNLFNDLIEIARLEYREDLIKPKVYDLSGLVDEVAEMLRPKAEDKGLALETANPSILVETDRARMRQVLTNLIDNAIAYTDEGTVRCRFRRRLDKVRVEVIDTGRGIPEEHLERVFERFYRVDPDRSRKSGGTGLGLSIVQQILHAHGEQIHVESTVGRGTRFWFELPYAGQPETAEAV